MQPRTSVASGSGRRRSQWPPSPPSSGASVRVGGEAVAPVVVEVVGVVVDEEDRVEVALAVA